MSVGVKRQRGFTLLEMLAAIVLLAIGSAVLLSAFGQSMRSLHQVEQSDRNAMAARSILDSVEGSALAPGIQRGTWEGIPWVLEVSREQEGRLDLYRLDLTLTQGDRQARYSTLRIRTAGGVR